MADHILNTWYVAAWSDEVTNKPIRRMICEQSIVLYRISDDQAKALADRCAHRAFPLSKGRMLGDSIECGYHGFTYGPDGRCTKVPGQTTLPERAVVRSYPLHEKDGWIWVWMGGDPADADPSDIPDTHWMNDPNWASVEHSLQVDCRAELVHDNLLDLTHESFLHKTTVGDDYIYEYGITVEVDDNVVLVDRLMPSVPAPPLYADTMGIDGNWDRFHATEFFVPNNLTLHSGITAEGAPREEGYLIKVLNAITPIDAHTCWYYYSFARNFAVDNVEATEQLREGLGLVLEEDKDALEAQELGMQTRPGREFDVLIAQDGGVAKARRIHQALLKKEAKEREAKEPRRPGAPANTKPIGAAARRQAQKAAAAGAGRSAAESTTSAEATSTAAGGR